MKETPHLFAAALALFVSLAAVIGFSLEAHHFEEKYVHAVAGVDHSATNEGSALERLALEQNDLLLIYGASELMLLDTKYQANRFFSEYPTGFMIFNAATKGGSALTIAQKLAAIGPELRGKRIVLSVGPAIMTMAPDGDVNTRHYYGNFSQLHAMELAFSPYLSFETKQLAAARMLEFPESFKDRPFLQFALEELAQNSLRDRLLYYLAYPLGRLQLAIMHVQDDYASVEFIRGLSATDVKITRTPQKIDWPALAAVAQKEQIKQTDTNPYGVDNSQWHKISDLFLSPVPLGSRDDDFIYDVNHAREWQDLDIALRVIRELGANVVIISSPMNVGLWKTIGVSEQAQNTYYEKLHAVVAPYGLPILDFRQFGTMKYFSMDLASHASREGWIYYDQTLDGIFHGSLP